MVLFQFDQRRRRQFIKEMLDELVETRPCGEMFQAWVMVTDSEMCARRVAELALRHGGWSEVYEVMERPRSKKG